MKSFFSIIAILFTSALFGQSNTESEIKKLSGKRVEWLLQNNVDSLVSLYDENSITIHGNGMIRTTAEHINDIKSGRPTYKSIEIKEASVKDFGNTAVLVGKGIFSISINGQEMTQNMVFTEVYIKKNNQWKLISRQASQLQ